MMGRVKWWGKLVSMDVSHHALTVVHFVVGGCVKDELQRAQRADEGGVQPALVEI